MFIARLSIDHTQAMEDMNMGDVNMEDADMEEADMEEANMEESNMEESNIENPNIENPNMETSNKEKSNKSKKANTRPKTGIERIDAAIKVIDDTNIPYRLKFAQKDLTLAQERYTSTESRLTTLKLTLPNFHFTVRKLESNVPILKEIAELKEARLRTISHVMNVYRAWCAEVERDDDPAREELRESIARMRKALRGLERDDKASDEQYLGLLKRLDPPFVEEDVVPTSSDQSAGDEWRARGGKGHYDVR